MKNLLLLTTVLLMAAGCSVKDDSLANDTEKFSAQKLVGTVWQIESIDAGGVIDYSMPTLQFIEAGRIAGFTSCNRYFGSIQSDGDHVTLSGIGATRKACTSAVAFQEQRMLKALEETYTLTMKENIWLMAHDADGKERLKMIQIEKDPTAE